MPNRSAKLLAFVLCTSLLPAQTAPLTPADPVVDAIALHYDRGSAAVWQSLRKLQTRASLLVINAHPDDEDGGMLTYESRGVGARVALLSLTRGEGGQNVMSDDYWDALGQVRTQELLQADRHYGSQLFFSQAADFGFSKTKEEAIKLWGHDRVLYDAVRVVRMTRPLVVTSTFVGGPTDGHGHHQVAGVLAQEVFTAAADPNIFPDQIKAGLLPWKPLKVYARIPFFAATPQGMYDYATGKYVPVRFYDYVHKGWIEGPLSTDVEVPSSKYDPILGQNYVQIARTGLGQQKTQNGGVGPAPAGGSMSGYHRFASAVPVNGKEQSFFDGIDTSIMGIAQLADGGDTSFLKDGLREINSNVEQAVAQFNADRPERVAPSLAKGLKATRALILQVEQSNLSPTAKYNVNHELRVKEQQFNDAIVQALGIATLAILAPEKDPTGRMSVFAGTPESIQVAIPGQEFWVKVDTTNQSAESLTVTKLSLKGNGGNWDVQPIGDAPSALTYNKTTSRRFKVRVPEDAKLTRPYFTRPSVEQPYYDILDNSSLNMPTSPYPLTAELELNYADESIHISQVVQSVRRVTGPGIEYRPLIVGPAISVSMSPKHGIVPLTGKKFDLQVALHSNVQGEAKGSLKLSLPQGWTSQPTQADFLIARNGEQDVTFEVTPGTIESKPYKITAVAEYSGKHYTEGYDLTGYEGLPRYPLYSPETYETRGVDVQVAPGLKIGYVNGTGDEVAKSLQDLGLNVSFLSPQDLAAGDLSRFDCIILGVRAYAVRPDLVMYNGRLLTYVNGGGVVLVQYNTGQYDHNYGPYPYSLTNDPEKVVDETAKVRILEPANPVMSWPNKITPADFDGWVEERGHSFMHSWDPHYTALTEVHDPDQEPQKGGLLYARHGKGAYIYAAYALYRQLPEGVPGAFRLIANIVSLAHSPEMIAVRKSADK
jgi:LmbE family N-acetylglucosaminyl deacetylase